MVLVCGILSDGIRISCVVLYLSNRRNGYNRGIWRWDNFGSGIDCRVFVSFVPSVPKEREFRIENGC